MDPYGDPAMSPGGPSALRLLIGGIATALVAGLIVVVGVLICRGIFDIPVLGAREAGYLGDDGTAVYAFAAACAALLATALLYLLLLAAPRAMAFWAWIVGLATLVAVLAPFARDAVLEAKIATAAINGVVGLAILTLLPSVASAASYERGRRAGAGGGPRQPDRTVREQQQPRYGPGYGQAPTETYRRPPDTGA